MEVWNGERLLCIMVTCLYTPDLRYIQMFSEVMTFCPRILPCISIWAVTLMRNSFTGAKPRPETKPKVLLAQKAPLSPQGNRSTSNNDDILPNDNRKRCKCRLCEGPHTNLVFCPKLPLYIPSGKKSVTLPEVLCTICLFTGFEQGINCRHNNVSL